MARATIRMPMPVKMRAKQFAMFDAMKGLTEAIAEKERQYTNKKDLSEDRVNEINDILCELQPGDDVEVGYYCQYGKTYRKVTGVLRKIDCYWKTVVIESTTISFGEIDSIVVKSNYTLI